MLTKNEKTKIFISSAPIDFRMSINSLSNLVSQNKRTHLYDGSIYVFYNKQLDKIKCLFWDKNGFVLYYKRLEGTRFKFTKMSGNLSTLTPDQLELILSGYDPNATTYLTNDDIQK